MKKKSLQLEQFVPYKLSIASNVVSDLIASSYQQKFHLSIPEWRLIAVLGERGQATQQQLCAITLMDKVTVSRAARTLHKRKLISKKPNLDDKRSQYLFLDLKGRSLYKQVSPQAIQLEAALLSNFKKNEIQHFLKMLNRLIDLSARV